MELHFHKQLYALRVFLLQLTEVWNRTWYSFDAPK